MKNSKGLNYMMELGLVLLFSIYTYFFFSLSRDTYDYISLANYIKEGRFYYSNNEYSTVWPLGYPLLIAAVSYLGLPLKISLFSLSLSLFIASYKLLGKILEGENGYVVAILILSFFHGIYKSNAAEPLFVFCIISILYVIKNFDYSLRSHLILAGLFFLLVETKHTGIFLIPFSIIYLNGFSINRKSLLLVLTTLPLLIVFILRLYFIGSITGENRIPNSDSLLKIIKGSFNISHYHEFKRQYHVYFFSILFLMIAAFGTYLKHYKKYSRYILYIFVLAIFYYCYIVLLRYRTFFSGLEPRFMVPYVLFSLICILLVFQKARKYFILFSVIILGISFYFNFKYKYKTYYTNDIFDLASFKGQTKVTNVIVDRQTSIVVANSLFKYEKTIIDADLLTARLTNNNKDSLHYGNGSVFVIKKSRDTIKIVDLTVNKNFKK
ncbi:hypothetical protein [Chryseobacterium phocaeense]|uniref:hypothetical protein n=1 Tax=Chryseobacterium phocaeense TaxID=1816690 RepID=UPI00111A101F|nr:hypothetical protein [Chryseobacterium phocaeense]